MQNEFHWQQLLLSENLVNGELIDFTRQCQYLCQNIPDVGVSVVVLE